MTTDKAAELRTALVETLLADGRIRSPSVEAAFRTVPRERFLPPEVPLDIAYEVDHSVVTKRDENGVAISSVSAAYIQASMLEQAELEPGMRVLEIGSGGLNASLIAEIVGPTGRVVSVDIDPEVTARAVLLLTEAGYGGRVDVLVADAEHGIPGTDRFDAIVVTVGAWDIAPAWLAHLTARGRLVLPLIMNGATRTIGFRRSGDHLVSTSMDVAGFVPMQGDGGHADRVALLHDRDGKRVKLRFDSGAPEDMSVLAGVLDSPQAEAWSGVTIEHGVSFADLHLWLAWYLPGFCLLVDDDGVAAERGMWFPFGAAHGSAIAYLAVRAALDCDGVEFGARAYGRDRVPAAALMVERIRAWDSGGRGTEPVFRYWPAGSDRSRIGAGEAVMTKAHGVVTMSWPTPMP